MTSLELSRKGSKDMYFMFLPRFPFPSQVNMLNMIYPSTWSPARITGSGQGT